MQPITIQSNNTGGNSITFGQNGGMPITLFQSGINYITNGLMAWYKFDEGSGTTANDSSGNGNTGTLINSPTWTTGKIDGALSFVSASSQYVNCGTNLGLGGRTSNLTICLWYYQASSNDHGAFFKLGNSTDVSGGDGVGVGISGQPATNGFETAGNRIASLYEGVRWIDSGVNTTTGWHQFAIVIDSSGNPTIYSDGNSIYSDNLGSMLAIGSVGTSIAQVGGYTSSIPSNRFWTGKLDDVRIYNRALSPTEITTIYNLQG